MEVLFCGAVACDGFILLGQRSGTPGIFRARFRHFDIGFDISTLISTFRH